MWVVAVQEACRPLAHTARRARALPAGWMQQRTGVWRATRPTPGRSVQIPDTNSAKDLGDEPQEKPGKNAQGQHDGRGYDCGHERESGQPARANAVGAR